MSGNEDRLTPTDDPVDVRKIIFEFAQADGILFLVL